MQNCSAMPTRGGLQVHYARHLEQHRRRWCSLQAVQEDQIRNTALELTAANERTEHVLREVTLYPFTPVFASLSIPVTTIIWLGWRIQLLGHASLHTHNHTRTHSLSLVLVVMMRSKEFKTSRSILMLIL